MNPKYRFISLFLGFTGLAALIFEMVTQVYHIDPRMVLLIAIPDMLFFYIAYKTYPVESIKQVD
jgi:hypothetical protein